MDAIIIRIKRLENNVITLHRAHVTIIINLNQPITDNATKAATKINLIINNSNAQANQAQAIKRH